MSDSQKLSRRELFASALHLGILAPAAFALLNSKAIYAADLPFVTVEKSPVAKALKYSETAKVGCKDKSGVACPAQNCGNCQLYVDTGVVGGKPAGKCTMIPGFVVAKSAWCSSWTKKA
jgi:hypothetical protein